jgi:hypothetical protein
VREPELGQGLGQVLGKSERQHMMGPTLGYKMGHWESRCGAIEGMEYELMESESSPCVDESGGYVTGQGHSRGGNDRGGKPCGSGYGRYPPWLAPRVDWPDTGHQHMLVVLDLENGTGPRR